MEKNQAAAGTEKTAKPAIKGRGAGGNPAGRFQTLTREAKISEVGEGITENPEDAPPPLQTTLHWDSAKTIIIKNDSPDIPHNLSANPYRGCEHGCIYCFARPTHSYLGLSPGLDFETQIFAKRDAAAVLRRDLSRRGYRPQPLVLGVITDAYQPLERKLRVTREMLETLAECRHPVSLITKSALIERDLDILTDMARDGLADASVSITSLDNALTRRLEPRAAAPARRLKIIERLSAAGVPVTVLMAPIIPAITDSEVESLLTAAAQAGASGAGYVLLRLPHELKEVFGEWLQTHMPLRAEKVMSQLRAMHGGRDYNSNFFVRRRGRGVFADLLAARFERARKAAGLDKQRHDLRCDLFAPPQAVIPPQRCDAAGGVQLPRRRQLI